ncbi:MAG: phage terminase large subunit [Isosphaeraceae bacterium]
MRRFLSSLLVVVLMVATLSDLHADRFAEAVRAAGNPRDQIERLLRAGIVLQPRQLMACAAARLCDHDGGPTEIGFGGARGGGKSHCAIALATDDCLRYPGLKVLLLRKVGKANRENFEDLRIKVLPGVSTSYLKSEGKLVYNDARDAGNPSYIKVGHFQNPSDIDAYLGLEYDAIIVEEATTLTSSKVKDVLTCLRTSKPGWRPRAYFTTNPGNVGHAWFKARFITPWRAGKETDTRFIQSTVADNSFVNKEYRKQLEGLTGWKLKAWLFGDWDIAAGQYFTTWRHATHVWPEIEAQVHWRYWVALDYGFAHYTAAYLFGMDGDGTVYVLDEHAERQWLVPDHARAILAMVARHGLGDHQIEAWLAGGDVFNRGRDGRAVADDYNAAGIPLQRANNNRRDGAAEVLRRLGDVDRDPPIPPTLFIAERCKRLIECIPSLMHDDRTGYEDVKKVDCDEDGFGGDDYYDAFRYGCMHVAGGPRLLVRHDDDPYRG